MRKICLPILRTTEEAEDFGRQMTPSQYVLLEGARQALQGEFEKQILRGDIRARLAYEIQLFREAQESAPDSTLCAVHELQGVFTVKESLTEGNKENKGPGRGSPSLPSVKILEEAK